MLHSNRMRARDEVRLKYEELPDNTSFEPLK